MAKQFKEVSAQVEVDELERGILDFWEKEKIFEKSVKQREGEKEFTFYDGPPYATGKPHYGHVLQSSLKDTVLRYKTMRGYHAPRRVGWDTHGLPVEVLVEKELGLKTKQDVEKMGVAEFNQKCRETVFRYIDEFTNTLKRMGRWADYDNYYATLNRDYMETEWWVFKQLWEKKLVYKDFRSTPYCIRCATPLSNFEVSMAYQNKTDKAVYVLLPVNEKLSLLIWTTTPWTLPANVAVAYSKKLKYVSVKHDDKEVIVAAERVKAVFGDEVEIVREWSSEELESLKYEGLYTSPAILGEGKQSDLFSKKAEMYSLVAADHVTAEEGTGLVHMAPAFGAEDAEVGKKYGLPVLKTVDGNGRFDLALDFLQGKKIWDGNKLIIDDLKERGLLFKAEKYKHSYPFCWRCDEPLIYYALDTWFVKVTDFKDEMIKNNEQIHWIPEHVKNGRFGKGLESAPDWAVSRNRFWSTPIPIWECDDCGERVCVGSVEELKQLAEVEEVEDLHRPYVDELKWDCEECGGEMKRIPEVLDVWFDAGSMPYAQWHYPFEKEDLVKQGFPADFIVEAIEMTRAWFYVMHVLATALMGKPAYLNVIASGIIFAENGKKLSKKLKNYPEIMPTLEKYGADVTRMYLLTSSSLGEPYRFSENDLKKLAQNVHRRLWNVYSFFVRYAKVAEWAPSPSGPPAGEASRGRKMGVLDRWILARVTELERDVVTASDEYQVDQAARYFVTFIDDLSNWYVRRSRGRFQRGGEEKAFATLHEVLARLSKTMAPFMPFLAEDLYRNLTDGESVHLERLEEKVELSDEDREILESMRLAREIVSEGLALRAKVGIKARQPLAELVVVYDQKISDELLEIIREEVNVKSVKLVNDWKDQEGYERSGVDAKVGVALKTEIDAELALEGRAREVIRHGQLLRRQAGYALDDKILVGFEADDQELKDVMSKGGEVIAMALQAEEIVDFSKLADVDAEAEVKVSGRKLKLGVFRKK